MTVALGHKWIKFLLGTILVVLVFIAGWAMMAEPAEMNLHVTDRDSMVHVPAGVFRIHGTLTEVSGYWIDQFEVTERDWQRFLQESASFPWEYPSFEVNRGPDYPVRWVTYPQACAFAAFYQKRIPSNIEWERAALGTKEMAWPWGNAWIAAANVAGTWERGKMAPRVTRVGLFERGRSPCGAYDMVGNVWEWTSSDPTESLVAGSFETGQNARYRIVRGGAFNSYPLGSLGSFERLQNSRVTAAWDLGFRCVISDEELEFQEQAIGWIKDLAWPDIYHRFARGRPAAQELLKSGKKSLPYLNAAFRSCSDEGVRGRIDDLVKQIRKGS